MLQGMDLLLRWDRQADKGFIFISILSLWCYFAVLLIMLEKFPLALIALIPNMIPLLLTLAALKIMGSDLQVTNIVSFTVAIGLAVDDTIHFIADINLRENGKPHREAIQASFHGAGHAIILTSIFLILGFGVLVDQAFPQPISLVCSPQSRC